jgi:hypothetical protein
VYRGMLWCPPGAGYGCDGYINVSADVASRFRTASRAAGRRPVPNRTRHANVGETFKKDQLARSSFPRRRDSKCVRFFGKNWYGAKETGLKRGASTRPTKSYIYNALTSYGHG